MQENFPHFLTAVSMKGWQSFYTKQPIRAHLMCIFNARILYILPFHLKIKFKPRDRNEFYI